MKLADGIYFYEGDYLSKTRFMYRGMGSSNFMVIRGREQVLVDSGYFFGPHKKRVLAEMSADGLRLEDTTCVLFSHSHPDHILNAKIMSKKKDIAFLLHEASEPIVRRESFQYQAHYNFPSYIMREILGPPRWLSGMLLRRNYGFDYLKIQKFFKDRERIRYGIDIEVVELSSHFPGHVGFYFPEQKIFYSGDLFDRRISAGGMINNALSDYERVFVDVDRIRKLKIDVLVPGHGRIIPGKDAIRTLLDDVQIGTEKYLSDIIFNLKRNGNGGLTLTRLTDLIYGKSYAYNHAYRKIITYNCLSYLKKHGRVNFSIKNRKAHWTIL